MAEDKLGKTVRIDEKTYVPKGAKLEVWTKGRHKYLVKYLDPKGIKAPATDTIRYINNSKISASLSDDEVIKEWLLEREAAAKIIPSLQVYKVIQDPYSDEPAKRVYGDGKSPYYLNNGCKIFIEWSGYIPNPKFDLGTFSTAKEAQNNKKPGGPDRYLSNQPITSSEDNSKLYGLPPFSTWVVPTGEVNAALEPVDNYRDYSSVDSKKISVYLPDGFTENGGKGYLILTKNDELKYSTDPGNNEDTNRYSSTKDANIISIVISKFKSMVQKLHGISDYDLKLCEPDSEACKLIDYKSPLEPPNNTPEKAAINDTPPGLSQSNTKIKLSIQGLFDSSDGTTPGNTSSVFEIKAKTDMPTFTIWTGDIPQTELIDKFDDLQELDEEYIETDAVITEDQQIQLDLQVYLTQGDSEGTEDDTGTQTTTSGSGVNTNGTNAGGSGDRRFQQQLTIRGRVVKNGEIPNDLLAKVDFGGYLLEKHAAVKFSALNKAFKEKFGKNFTISGPYRPFNVGNNIFDWDYFNRTGKGRKKGTNGGVAAAKPGTSKHGWGQAMDIGGFGNGPGNQYFDWMEQNAKKYGWINPAWAKKPGAGYEPWHWEYIGDDLFAA
jgi:hypothetical protein